MTSWLLSEKWRRKGNKPKIVLRFLPLMAMFLLLVVHVDTPGVPWSAVNSDLFKHPSPKSKSALHPPGSTLPLLISLPRTPTLSFFFWLLNARITIGF